MNYILMAGIAMALMLPYGPGERTGRAVLTVLWIALIATVLGVDPAGDELHERWAVAPLVVAVTVIMTLVRAGYTVAHQIAFSVATILIALVASALLLPLFPQSILNHTYYGAVSPGIGIPIMLIAALILLRTRKAVWAWSGAREWSFGIGLFLIPPLAAVVVISLTISRRLLIDNGVLTNVGADRAYAAAMMTAVMLLVLWTARSLNLQQRRLFESYAVLNSADTMLLSLDGVIQAWSAGCTRLYGYDQSEVIGRNSYELLAARESGVPAKPPSCIDGRTSRVLEQKTKSGRTLHVIETSTCFTLASGEQSLSISVSDVTDQSTSEEALRLSHRRLELALDQPQIGGFDWDAERGLTTWTIANEEEIGLPRGYVDSMDRLRAITHPDDVERITEQFDQATAVQTPQLTFSYRVRTPTGVERVIKGTAHCEYDDQGKIARVIGANIDISERVGSKHALRQTESAHASRIAMVVINEMGNIIGFNDNAEALFDYSESEVIGRDIAYLLSPPRSDLPPQLAAELIAGGHRELSARHRDGSTMQLEIWAQDAAMGGDRKYILFVRDVRAIVESEDRLSHAREEIIQASNLRTVEEVAAGMAHEINQPLAAMVNHLAVARILLERSGNAAEPHVVEAVNQASSQALRAGAVIKRLNQFVRIGEPDVAPVNLQETVDETVAMRLVGNYQDQVAIEYDFPPDTLRVLADRVQLQQILLNLLRNALEAMRMAKAPAPRIVIAARRGEDNMLHISLADSGPGLPNEVLANICTPFFSTKRNGMGVGLSISRRIIEAHGGQLSAWNAVEGGAVFEFTLPVVGEEHLDQ